MSSDVERRCSTKTRACSMETKHTLARQKGAQWSDVGRNVRATRQSGAESGDAEAVNVQIGQCVVDWTGAVGASIRYPCRRWYR